MKGITFLKLALFSFISTIVFVFFSELTDIQPLYIGALISITICVIALTLWICIKIFHRFKHSINVILIIIFTTTSISTYFLIPKPLSIQNIEDIINANYISQAWIASVCACCISILTLIAQIIFAKSEKTYSEDLATSSSDETDTPVLTITSEEKN